jgi:hypothetical protein
MIVLRYTIRGQKVEFDGYVDKEVDATVRTTIINDTDGYDYLCPVDDVTHINSRSKHRENLKVQNSRVLEPGEKKHFENTRHEEADKEVAQMFERSLVNG